ncbi:hypothetical protein PBRA_009650 [Plasmodiophora brassicae]|uniref:DDE Tnp4 domain-containing protein n=1 Tax=Plasmodiophora brassicae TaxID=37360 RepID=A0A0G4IJN8_PLABS|nr:hypothetical protein PBRA_009650 [Plasmodiophora brassicae]
MSVMLDNRWFAVRPAGAEIDHSNHFDPLLPDAAARKRYRFTISELRRLRRSLKIPDVVVTKAGDKISGLEAIALLCRRLAEPAWLYTIANEFGRSEPAISRLFWHTAKLVYRNHKHLIYFNMPVVEARIARYCQAIQEKGAPLPNCWAFIDGTKQHLCRPSPRDDAPSGENLQRASQRLMD